jgi:hypothetical protein
MAPFLRLELSKVTSSIKKIRIIVPIGEAFEAVWEWSSINLCLPREIR